MSRPFMQHRIGQLEEMLFNSREDGKVLKALESELQQRHVPRAVALLAKVQNALKGAKLGAAAVTGPKPAAVLPPSRPTSRQPELWSGQANPAPSANPSRTAVEPPPMSAADAYKILKATPGSSWEAIEQNRRQLVQQAHPDRVAVRSPEGRIQVQGEAKRANAAYAVLRLERTGDAPR